MVSRRRLCHSGNASSSERLRRRAISRSILCDRRFPLLTRETAPTLMLRKRAISVTENPSSCRSRSRASPAVLGSARALSSGDLAATEPPERSRSLVFFLRLTSVLPSSDVLSSGSPGFSGDRVLQDTTLKTTWRKRQFDDRCPYCYSVTRRHSLSRHTTAANVAVLLPERLLSRDSRYDSRAAMSCAARDGANDYRPTRVRGPPTSLRLSFPKTFPPGVSQNLSTTLWAGGRSLLTAP